MRPLLLKRSNNRSRPLPSPTPSGAARAPGKSDFVDSNFAYQEQALPGVSRTFALTIPILPEGLREDVTNAYLLCRIADTIEDEPAFALEEKQLYQRRFEAVVEGLEDPEALAAELAPRLSSATLDAERELVRNLARVVRVTYGLDAAQRDAIVRCVRIMSEGMARFEGQDRRGLRDVQELHEYCYFVAGVVGEMLTELFCSYSDEIAARGDELRRLAVSFGLGLQLTNILKDIWDDLDRGACWLPRELFAGAGIEIDTLERGQYSEEFGACLRELVGLAHTHLRNALDYTLLLPASEPGIRKFCLWALGMAVLTIRKVNAKPDFQASSEVKISRRSVKATVLTTTLAVGSDRGLRAVFALLTRSLPLTPLDRASLPSELVPTADDRAQVGVDPVQADASFREGDAADTSALEAALVRARTALLALQRPDGCWAFELEADCTIPAEYILMMHYLGEVDEPLQAKLAVYLRERQADHGGWPLYHGGALDVSCSVKCYWALKLAGDDVESPGLSRAREAILEHGGAARSNVFTRIAMALFGEVPWRATPWVPVELILAPRWLPFHLSKVSYWTRTVTVPLSILCTLRVRAVNPTGLNIRELFVVDPERERHYHPVRTPMNRAFLACERVLRHTDRLIPGFVRRHALQKSEAWIIERLNGLEGLGAIFPAMVNALEALRALGHSPKGSLCTTAREALDRLLVVGDESAYCQPSLSPVWDTGLSSLALQDSLRALPDGGETSAAIDRGLAWLEARQVLDGPADWRDDRPDLSPGGWAFQFENPHYPDLDDTAVVAWAMAQQDAQRFAMPIGRAADWLRGMQSRNGGFASFEADNTHYYLNEIPFADHGALLDPPTADVSARCASLFALLGRSADSSALERCVEYLLEEQEESGAWFGRWGTNYVYGTWSVLAALEKLDDRRVARAAARAADWLESVQREDGSWAETNDSYFDPALAGRGVEGTSFQTAWAVLGLIAAGRVDCEAARRGVEYLLRVQREDGLWEEEWFTAPGFPRVFFLRYHGYSRFFPLWALARYLHATGADAR